jgi:hypothetical protein
MKRLFAQMKMENNALHQDTQWMSKPGRCYVFVSSRVDNGNPYSFFAVDCLVLENGVVVKQVRAKEGIGATNIPNMLRWNELTLVMWSRMTNLEGWLNKISTSVRLVRREVCEPRYSVIPEAAPVVGSEETVSVKTSLLAFME